MQELFFYLLKMTAFSSIMFGYYFIFLKDKTFHHYNRFYLLSIIIVSILLPLIKIEFFTIEVNPDIYILLQNFSQSSSQNFIQNDFTVFSIIFAGICCVSVFYIIKFFSGLYRIQLLKKKYIKTAFQGLNFYETPLQDAPFSYFKNLFWKDSIPLQSDLGKQILKHEMVHIEQKHTWDKLLITVVQAVFWFNPFFYLLKKEIALIHEYLADKKTIKQNDTKAFAQMLLQTHFSATPLPATSPFLSSNLKKRITMLKKSKTKFSYARKILALPLLFTIGFAFMVNAKNREIADVNEEIEAAVYEIKKDTIREKDGIASPALLGSVAFKENENFDDSIFNAPEDSKFSIDNKVVSKEEYLNHYKKYRNDQFYKFVIIVSGSGNGPKSYSTVNFKDPKNAKFETVFENYKTTEITKGNYTGTATYVEDVPSLATKIASSKIGAAMGNTVKGDLYFIDDVSYSKDEYFKNIDAMKKSGAVDLFFKIDTKNKDQSIYFVQTNSVKEMDNIFIEAQFKKNKAKFEKENADVSTIPATEWVDAAKRQNSPWNISGGAHPKPAANMVVKSDLPANVKYYLDGTLIEEAAFKKISPAIIKSVNVVKDKTGKNGGSIYIISK